MIKFDYLFQIFLRKPEREKTSFSEEGRGGEARRFSPEIVS